MSDHDFIDGPFRSRRFLGDPAVTNIYHVSSRIVGDAALLQDPVEKEKLAALMADMAGLCCVHLLTYCVMDNHFHVLVEIPARASTDLHFPKEEREARLLKHLRVHCESEVVDRFELKLATLRAKGDLSEVARLIEEIIARMGDLSWYVKEVKERFSRWYNGRHDRRGTLWMERFRSVLVQSEESAQVMAAYIDLNPVRAGSVSHPKDYRWCGYGVALATSSSARVGLCRLFGKELSEWGQGEIGDRYLTLFDMMKAPPDQGDSTTPSRLDRNALLKCRVRYFTDGLAIGTSEYLQDLFRKRRGHFGPKRTTGPRPMRGGDWGELRSLRDLTRSPVRFRG